MRTNSTITNKKNISGKININAFVILRALCSLFILLISVNVFSQTFPPPSSCTSKDLELISATLPAPANDRCQCSGNRTLVLGIRNKTGSTRTSFALWGTLKRYNSSGEEIGTGTPIFACAGPIKKNSDNFLPATSGMTTITVNCGESLEIVDLYLAWTSASPGETCAVLEGSPSTINPKCGTLGKITVGIGVDAALATTKATCNTGGTIKVTPSGGIPPYEVKLDGGSYIAVPTNTGYYEFTNVSGGQHTVIIRDNTSKPIAERCSTTKTPTVGSTTPPTAGIDANRTTVTCTNPSATLTASGGTSYSWSDGTGEVGTEAELTVSPTTNTTYTVTVTDANGCTDEASQEIVVDKDDPTAAISANRTTVTCTNTSATLTASGGGSYSWSPGGATTAQITVSPTTTTTYTVTVTGANGCTDEASQEIVVDKDDPTAAISANRTTVTCTNTSATLTASGGGSYSWSPGGATTAQITVSPTTTTTYTVTVTGANGCTDEASQEIVVDKQLPSFTVCIVEPSLCSQYGSVTFNATNGSGFTYSINNGTSFGGSATINNLASGSVTGFAVKGSNGCVSSASCDEVDIVCPENLVGRSQKGGVTTQEINLTRIPKNNITAAPNPFNDRIRFTLKSDVSGQGTLELYNTLGQKVKTVFQGQVKAGQIQTIEYAVPSAQRTNLIYLFRVGDQTTTGKLVGLKQ